MVYFFFKQKTAYEMRISDWSSDVCSSDLPARASGSDTLWPVLRASAVSKTHLSSEVVRQLNTFRDHLNTAFGNPDMPVIPPGPDGKPWRITTRQFRRTIAWHIANRQFGTIAGMRSEERHGGKDGVSTGRSRWSPVH